MPATSHMLGKMKASARNYLAKHGLIGKIRLSSEMMEEEIFKEIYSVFADAMNGNPRFDFSILQQAGWY